MTIITNAKTVEGLMEKYAVKAPLNLTVITGKEDNFSADTVKALLSMNAEIVQIPDGALAPFVFGMVAGRYSKPDNVYVVTDDTEIRKSAALCGFRTDLAKKATTGGRTVKRAVNGAKQASTAAGKKAGGADTIKTRKAEKEDAAAKAEPTKKPRSRKIETDTPKDESVKTKAKPQKETVYEAKDSADIGKASPEFVTALKKAGVNKADAQGVWNAVSKSSAAIVYDMQLRLCLLDAEKAKAIYDKTRNSFDELKEMTKK